MAERAALIEADGWHSERVRAVATLRNGPGVSLPPYARFNLGGRCGDDDDAVARNRALLVEAAGLPAAPTWLHQVHGTRVVRAPLDRSHEPEADAAVTSVPGVVLAVLSADCLTVALADVDGGEVAVAHAGWRGLAAGVLEATVAAMRTPPARVQAWLGPAAGPGAYEVGDEVRAVFLAGAGTGEIQRRGVPRTADERHGRGDAGTHASAKANANAGANANARPGVGPIPDAEVEANIDGDAYDVAAAFIASRPGHWWCDLYSLARLRLARAGVTQVAGGGHCTISEPDAFFSHRRDGRCGRMATLAWLEP